MLFHAPYQVFIRALKSEELATGTSAFFLVRFTGATVGLVSGSDDLSFARESLPERFAGCGWRDFLWEGIPPPTTRPADSPVKFIYRLQSFEDN